MMTTDAGFTSAVETAIDALAIQRRVCRDPQGFVIHAVTDGTYRVYSAREQEPGGLLPPGRREGTHVATVDLNGAVTLI